MRVVSLGVRRRNTTPAHFIVYFGMALYTYTCSLEGCKSDIYDSESLWWLLRLISCCWCFSFSSSVARSLQLIIRQQEIGPMLRSERFRYVRFPAPSWVCLQCRIQTVRQWGRGSSRPLDKRRAGGGGGGGVVASVWSNNKGWSSPGSVNVSSSSPSGEEYAVISRITAGNRAYSFRGRPCFLLPCSNSIRSSYYFISSGQSQNNLVLSVVNCQTKMIYFCLTWISSIWSQ